MDWIAFCLIWHIGPSPYPEVELRVGTGRYNAQQHLHWRVHAGPRAELNGPLGVLDSTNTCPPMRNFLRCR